MLTPAREVGGDLYDYFMLDERRLFVLIGDVSGKGLPASDLHGRQQGALQGRDAARAERRHRQHHGPANAELSRDNAQQLFVTAFACILDLDSGVLDVLQRRPRQPLPAAHGPAAGGASSDGDGPPLCAIDDFAYRSATLRWRRGDVLCLMTDGVTDAQDAAARCTAARAAAVARRAGRQRGAMTARGVVEAMSAT